MEVSPLNRTSVPQTDAMSQLRAEREATCAAKAQLEVARQDRLAQKAEAGQKLSALLHDWLGLAVEALGPGLQPDRLKADGPMIETGEWRYCLIRRGANMPEGLTMQRRYPPNMRVGVHSWIPPAVAWDAGQAQRAVRAINEEYERAERISARAG